MKPREHQGFIEGVGRLRLHFRATEVEEPRAAILIVHGLSEHSGRYSDFVSAMAQFGFSSYAIDQRGHGLSEGRRGHVSRFEILLQDIDRFRREIIAMLDISTPTFLLGHSFGGLVALRYLEEYETAFAGAIISSPWLGTAVAVPHWKLVLANISSKLLPTLPFKIDLDPDLISHDPAVVQAYKDDPLVHGLITPRLFTETSAEMGVVLQRGDRVRLPLLLLLAGQDRIVDTRRSLALASSLRGNVETRVYPEAYHEVLNEPDRRATYQEVRDWIERIASIPDEVRN